MMFIIEILNNLKAIYLYSSHIFPTTDPVPKVCAKCFLWQKNELALIVTISDWQSRIIQSKL